MTATPDPNWMTIAGLIHSTLGALLLGRVLLAQGRLLTAARGTVSNPSQMRFDTLFGMSLIGAGAILQVIAQLGMGDASGHVALILLTLIAVLMVYALSHSLFGETAAPLTSIPRAPDFSTLPSGLITSSGLRSTLSGRPVAITSIGHAEDYPQPTKTK